jgi:hypothetical protein
MLTYWPDDAERQSARLVAVASLVVVLASVLVVSPANASSGGVTPVAVTISSGSVTFSPAFAPIGSVVFRVRNRTSSPRVFTVAGHPTVTIAPGASATVTVTLTARRGYPYAVSPGSSAGMSGYFNAVAPCAQPRATTVKVTLTTGSIKLSEPSLQCGTVTFLVTNTDPSNFHDFSLDLSLLGASGQDVVGQRLAPGQSISQRVSLPVRGNIYYFSSQPEDSENGLSGYLKVT